MRSFSEMRHFSGSGLPVRGRIADDRDRQVARILRAGAEDQHPVDQDRLLPIFDLSCGTILALSVVVRRRSSVVHSNPHVRR
jgi:hypothetical protein